MKDIDDLLQRHRPIPARQLRSTFTNNVIKAILAEPAPRGPKHHIKELLMKLIAPKIALAGLLIGVLGVGATLWLTPKADIANDQNKEGYSHIKDTPKEQQADKQEAQSHEATEKTTYFVIKEWGVRMPYSGSQNLTYKMNGSISSTQLSALDPECNAGFVARYNPGDQAYAGSAPGDGSPTAEDVAKSDKSYVHVGGYYYRYHTPHAACNSDRASALQRQIAEELERVSLKLEAAR